MVVLRLLDSAQGRPVQVWRFTDRREITIGRSEESDVAIADQQVSRVHAKLAYIDNQWTLFSLGRNGTLVDDRLISEHRLDATTVFRLGPSGPLFKFELGGGAETAPGSGTETIGNIPQDFFAQLEVDELRKVQEVEQITENSLFKDLVDQSRSMKARRHDETQP